MTERLAHIDRFFASLGHEAYRVGGSVRDEILGRSPKDADYMVRDVDLWDLGESLRDAGAKISRLTTRDGRQIGWRAVIFGTAVEIALPRREESTGAGHRDFEITIDPHITLSEDAERRDFTFNALYRQVSDAYGEVDVLFDPTGRGLDDLRHKRINVTHADSFRDDPLRILRALRFVSTLNYDLAPETRYLMEHHADAVTGLTIDGNVSGTVFEEIDKLLMGQCPAKALRIARDAGVLRRVLPELAPMLGHNPNSRYHDLTTDEHTFKALEVAAHVDAPQRVRWALLYHDSGKRASEWVGTDGRSHFYEPSDEVWEKVKHNPLNQRSGPGPAIRDSDSIDVWLQWFYKLKPRDHEVESEENWQRAAARLTGLPARLRKDVSRLILDHMVSVNKANPVKVRRERVRLGDEMLHDLYLMRACDFSAKDKVDHKPLETLREMESLRKVAAGTGCPSTLKGLKIQGRDVQALGVEGRDIGRVLEAVLDEVIVDPVGPKLTREWQLEAAARHA